MNLNTAFTSMCKSKTYITLHSDFMKQFLFFQFSYSAKLDDYGSKSEFSAWGSRRGFHGFITPHSVPAFRGTLHLAPMRHQLQEPLCDRVKSTATLLLERRNMNVYVCVCAHGFYILVRTKCPYWCMNIFPFLFSGNFWIVTMRGLQL